MPVNIRKLELQLRAVSNARRLGILRFLKKNRSATVSDIADAVRLHLQSASQHLRILKNAGIVKYHKRGLYVTYRLSLQQEEPTQKILSML